MATGGRFVRSRERHQFNSHILAGLIVYTREATRQLLDNNHNHQLEERQLYDINRFA